MNNPGETMGTRPLKNLCEAGLISTEECLFRSADQDQMRQDLKL